MLHLLHVLDGLESEHRGYNMKNAELFRRGEGPEISTLDRFDQTLWNKSIWDKL